MYKEICVTVPYKKGTHIPIMGVIIWLSFHEHIASVTTLRRAKARHSTGRPSLG
jgi:hypothetical protein